MKSLLLAAFLLLLCASPIGAQQRAYFVQAINTESQAKAESVRNDLKLFGNAQIYKNNGRFAVRLGPVADGKQAVRMRNAMRKKYPDAFITLSDAAATQNKTAKPARTVENNKKAPAAATPVGPAATAAPAANPPVQQETANQKPAPEAAPPNPEELLKEAVSNYQSRRYEQALGQLTLFLSLYPADSNASSAMLALAGIMLEMKRPISALRIYSRIIDGKPESQEAFESIMAITDMSIISPGLKPSGGLSGAFFYLHPVYACNQLLSRDLPADLKERVSFQRVAALRAKGRYPEAYAAGVSFIEQFPLTKRRTEMMMALRLDILRLLEENITAGDDITAISLFTHARRHGLIKMTDTDILIKAARSYARIGLSTEATSLLNNARRFAAARSGQIDAAIEELKKSAPAAPAPEEVASRWTLYETGMKQIRSDDMPAAKKTFAKLKETYPDDFLSKLADFAVKDGAQMSKYDNYIR